MFIDNYYNSNYRCNYNNNINTHPTHKYVTNISFGTNINAISEKGLQKGEYALRIIGNRITDLFESKKIKSIIKYISELKIATNEKYLNQLEEISRFYSSNKIIDVNIEDKILEKIASDGKSAIFIMNHSNQKEDPSMLAVLSNLLIKAYQKAGKHNVFPLPKIILNQDILTSMSKTKYKAFEAIGAVGIDANIYSAKKDFNVKAFFPIFKHFIHNKCNIFIFPEGKLAIRKDLNLYNRFQPGVAQFVNKALTLNKEITVVPIGFAYGKHEKKMLNAIQIGEPIIFKRNGENTSTTSGNVLKSKFAFDGFKKFFEKHLNETDVTITENGIPVKPAEITEYIKSILCENLNICAKEAKKRIQKPFNPNEFLTY